MILYRCRLLYQHFIKTTNQKSTINTSKKEKIKKSKHNAKYSNHSIILAIVLESFIQICQNLISELSIIDKTILINNFEHPLGTVNFSSERKNLCHNLVEIQTRNSASFPPLTLYIYLVTKGYTNEPR